jgi:O-antigen/teichoic acid export membrane protein
MALAMATVNVISYAVQYYFFRLLASEIRIGWSLVRRSTVRELGSYCFGLTVWSFAMFLINGLDLLLVGRFDFASLAPYAVASSLINFVAGAQYALFSAMMPKAATMHAGDNSEDLGKLVITSTRIGTMLVMLLGLTLFLYSTPILRAWVGPSYALHAQRLLQVLLVANMIRLIWVPYSVVVVGTGQQRLLMLPALVEGLTNLTVSVFLGIRYGAIGIAYGTLAGSVVAGFASLFYSFRRTHKQITFSGIRFVCQGVAVPSLVAIPLVTLFAGHAGTPQPAAAAVAFTISLLMGTAIWKWPEVSEIVRRVGRPASSTNIELL